MISNLEGIRFTDVINPEGLSYSEFRQTLKPDYIRTWLHIIAGLLCLAALLSIFIIIENTIPGWYWLTIPIFSVLAGFTIAFINLFIHEASHYYIHSNKKTNDLLANIFYAHGQVCTSKSTGRSIGCITSTWLQVPTRKTRISMFYQGDSFSKHSVAFMFSG